MKRQLVTEAGLIEQIRARLGQGECRECCPTALGPIKPVSGSANWQVLEHPSCSDPCQARMLEVCADLATSFDVDWPSARGAAR
ncbi:MAG: hypothetical protein ACREUE_08085 [Panacagrimonas sp.]